MLKFGNKEFRNLEEQVEKNKEDIENLAAGISAAIGYMPTIKGIYATAAQIPAGSYNTGDTFLIGSSTPYAVYVYTADNTWQNVGQFPVAGPKGDKGEKGSQILYGNTDPTIAIEANEGDYYIHAVSGDWFIKGVATWSYALSLKGEKGDRGEQGLAGPQGQAGPKGDKGEQGPRGIQGVQGVQGPEGPKGATVTDMTNTGHTTVGTVTTNTIEVGYSDGTTTEFTLDTVGVKGDKGDTGATGATGPQGPEGPRGLQGPKGDKGDPGKDGAQGATGPAGPAGPQGEQGIQGIQGEVGPQGPAGPEGPEGPMGPEGPRGEKGSDGANGVTPTIYASATVDNNVGTPSVTVSKSGADETPNFTFNFKNLKGDKGEQGVQGEPGDKGDTGSDGAPGKDGASGYTFTPSVSESGELTWTKSQDAGGDVPTPVNIKGPKGDTGATGETGPEGPQGPQGEQGVQGPAGDPATVIAGDGITVSTSDSTATVSVDGTVLEYLPLSERDGKLLAMSEEVYNKVKANLQKYILVNPYDGTTYTYAGENEETNRYVFASNGSYSDFQGGWRNVTIEFGPISESTIVTFPINVTEIRRVDRIPSYGVYLTLPTSSTQGTITEEEYTLLENNNQNYIVINRNEIYRLNDKGHTEGIWTYTHDGYNEGGVTKYLNLTVATRAFTITEQSGGGGEDYLPLTGGTLTGQLNIAGYPYNYNTNTTDEFSILSVNGSLPIITQDIMYSSTGYNTTKIGLNNPYSRVVLVAPKGVWVQDGDGNVSQMSSGSNIVYKEGNVSSVVLTEEEKDNIFTKGMTLVIKSREGQYENLRGSFWANDTGTLLEWQNTTSGNKSAIKIVSYKVSAATDGGYKIEFYSQSYLT